MVTRLVESEPDLTARLDSEPKRSFDAIDAAIVVARHKSLIWKVAAITAVITAVVVFLLPKSYLAEAVILPPKQNQSLSASMLNQLAPLAGLIGKDIGGQNSTELYVSMLKSRTIANALVKKFDLVSYYGSKTVEDARSSLAQDSDINSRKEGVIVIDVENKDPKRAADIANAYIDELKTLNSQLAFSEASRRKLFFEKERVGAKEDLEKAEVELQKAQEKSGLIQLDAQAKAIIENVAAARAQVAASEVRLATMRSFATADNPDLKREEQQLASLREQLAQLERGQGGKGNVLVPTGNIPSAGLTYVQRLRDVKYSEALFELLSKEYEAAKLDEARESAIVQVIDPAEVPLHKAKPKRLLSVILMTLAAVFLTVAWLLIRNLVRTWSSVPENKARVSELLAG